MQSYLFNDDFTINIYIAEKTWQNIPDANYAKFVDFTRTFL
jgi:hypothetical protein